MAAAVFFFDALVAAAAFLAGTLVLDLDVLVRESAGFPVAASCRLLVFYCALSSRLRPPKVAFEDLDAIDFATDYCRRERWGSGFAKVSWLFSVGLRFLAGCFRPPVSPLTID